MCCSQLSMLKQYISEEQIENLAVYLINLNNNTRSKITVTKIMTLLGVDSKIARKVLMLCKKENILSLEYVVRCPECGMLIKRYDQLPVDFDDIKECYSCGEEIEITTDDIELIFTYNIGTVSFNKGQLENIINIGAKGNEKLVAPESSLKTFIISKDLDLNRELFSPTDEEYSELIQMCDNVRNSSTTDEKGISLEKLIKYLFNISRIFLANEIKTLTNQLDCVVRNRAYLPLGVLNIIGGRFVIECKNENKTPSGTYMSKLHSIISTINGKRGDYVKFGIIVSKKDPPKTFHSLAVKYYLSENIIIISITLDEIEELAKNRLNLFDLLERKCDEIAIDSTTDLRAAGLYE